MVMEIQDKDKGWAREHAEPPMDETFISLLEARRLLSIHFSDLAHTKCRHKAKSLFTQGDKNCKLLAMRVAKHKINSTIPEIKTSGGDYLLTHGTF